MKAPAGLAAVGLVLAAFSLSLSSQSAATTILYFLPPTRGADPHALTDSFMESTRGWTRPAELAISLIANRGISDRLTQSLARSKNEESRKAMESSYLLWEEGNIQTKILDTNRLSIQISGSNPRHLRLYSLALVEALSASLKKLAEERRLSTQIEDGLVNSLETLQMSEEKLLHGIAEPESNGKKYEVAMNFGLEHYREAWSERLAWLRRRTLWSAQIENVAPSFVVLSGPDIQAKAPKALRYLFPMGAMLSLLGLILLGKSRTSKP